MTDNLILYCGIGILLLLLCNAALVARLIFIKSDLQKYYLDEMDLMGNIILMAKPIRIERDLYKKELDSANELILEMKKYE
jgi:hypothetical protein